MITMIEQKQKVDKIGKQKQNDNLREKNTEISWKNKKRRQTDVNRPKKRRLLKFQKETNWQLKRKEYRNIIVK